MYKRLSHLRTCRFVFCSVRNCQDKIWVFFINSNNFYTKFPTGTGIEPVGNSRLEHAGEVARVSQSNNKKIRALNHSLMDSLHGLKLLIHKEVETFSEVLLYMRETEIIFKYNLRMLLITLRSSVTLLRKSKGIFNKVTYQNWF